jgi:hypothetical protein
MYKLLKDKNNEFQCEIRLEGTTSKNAKARLFLEADGCEYVFSGRIQNERCVIPMGRLKKYANLLESGNIRLEIIAEDTVFTPYENTYELDEERKVTVEVIQPDYSIKKPIVEVKVEQPKVAKKQKSKLDPVKEIKSYLQEISGFDGTIKSFKSAIKNESNKKFINVVCETFKLDKSEVIKQLIK